MEGKLSRAPQGAKQPRLEAKLQGEMLERWFKPSLCPSGRNAGEMVQAHPSVRAAEEHCMCLCLPSTHLSQTLWGRGGHAWAAKGICRPKEAMLDFMKYCEPNGWGHKDVAWRWEVPSWAKRSVGSQSMWGFSAREAEIMLAQHSPPTHTHRLA